MYILLLFLVKACLKDKGGKLIFFAFGMKNHLPSEALILACSSKISSCVIDSSLATFSLWISSTSLFNKIFLPACCTNPSPEIRDGFENFAVLESSLTTSRSSSVHCNSRCWCFGTPNVTAPEAANCWANKLFLPLESVAFEENAC